VSEPRAVVALPELPAPPRCGNAWRDLQQLAVLRRLGFAIHLIVAGPRWDLTDDEEAAAVRGLDAAVTYLALERTTPRPALARRLARKASYLARPAVHPFGWWLPRTLAPAVADLRGSAADVLLLRSVFLHEIPRLRRVWPGRIVVDCHDSDVHLARELLKTVGRAARLGPWANLVGVRRIVARCLPLADEVWTVSLDDAAQLAGQAPGARLVVVPSGMDAAAAASTAHPGVDGRALLVASFGYGPNARGAEWLLRRVWPAVRRAVPAATLACVGGRMPEPLARLSAATEGVEAPGLVADLAPWMGGAAIVLAPVLEGGGTRLKIVEAWSQGKAVVATSKAIEGLPREPGAAVIAADPDAFAAETAALLVDRDRRRALGARALEVFRERLTWDVAARAVAARSLVGAGRRPTTVTT
jgi:polysaccharide biosynthesis protein PslH